MEECYRSGLKWLAYSGIQAESGGVSRYFNGDRGEYKDVSTEITAYAIQAYLQLPLPSETGLLSNALRAGQFLCFDAGDPQDGLFPVELTRAGAPSRRQAYFFDCGIIIRALLGLWHTTADPMYLERAERCGAMLLDRMSRVDGAFFSVLDLDSGVPSASQDNWSLDAGVHQLKVGLAFLELAESTSSGLFSKTADRLLGGCLRTHEVFLPGSQDPPRVVDRLHAYCYFLEGLLPFLDKRFECVQVLQSGLSRVDDLAAAHRDLFERCDVIAQLLRLRLIAECSGVIELDPGQASREAESLPKFQMQTDDPRTNGAFSFGAFRGQPVPHANPAATIFALQALRMWDEYQRGEMRVTWRELI